MCDTLDLNKNAIDAWIPGEIHQHLFQANKTKHDVLYREEHINQKWISMQEWSYETKVPTHDVTTPKMMLKLAEIGVISDVYFNNKKVGSTENLYRTYYFPVDVDLSANAENTLRIDI